MDLVKAATALKEIASLFEGSPDAGEPWAESEEAFLTHFGAPYEYLCEVVAHLDREQASRFDATMEVNPEAAVLWALAMEPS